MKYDTHHKKVYVDFRSLLQAGSIISTFTSTVFLEHLLSLPSFSTSFANDSGSATLPVAKACSQLYAVKVKTSFNIQATKGSSCLRCKLGRSPGPLPGMSHKNEKSPPMQGTPKGWLSEILRKAAQEEDMAEEQAKPNEVRWC